LTQVVLPVVPLNDSGFPVAGTTIRWPAGGVRFRNPKSFLPKQSCVRLRSHAGGRTACLAPHAANAEGRVKKTAAFATNALIADGKTLSPLGTVMHRS